MWVGDHRQRPWSGSGSLTRMRSCTGGSNVTPDLFEEMGAIRLKAVITVLGKDRPGIIAKIATALYEREVNIDDISQTIMQGLFTMVMIVDLGKLNTNIEELQAKMQEVENELGMQIRVKREEVFTAMHQI